MLKRKAYQKLVEWKNTHRNNCLMVKGARQVGKTYLVREFGKKEYKSFVEINFIKNQELKQIFILTDEDKELMLLIEVVPETKDINNGGFYLYEYPSMEEIK